MHVSTPTHEVTNQPLPFADVDLFSVDLALQEAVEREGGGWGVDRLRDDGHDGGVRRRRRSTAAAPSATSRGC